VSDRVSDGLGSEHADLARVPVLIRDQRDRDAIASDLLRYRDERGDDRADIIDMLTLHAGERRRVVGWLAKCQLGRGTERVSKKRVADSQRTRNTVRT
jgi:hypothetical protein